VQDATAEFYLETARAVFMDHDLPRGKLECRGRRVDTSKIRTALLTIEGAKDEMCPPGQTEAAHGLCSGIPAERKHHHVQEGVGKHPGYTLAKYGMTLLTLGFAEEFRGTGIHANCLWPRTTIATAAVENLMGGAEASARARRPDIMADAAYAILTSDESGRCFIDDEVLGPGVDLDAYRVDPDAGELELDFFVDPEPVAGRSVR
jgi:NAD(P)-dependent dehydrogenase (short-subunit alcohol dehydrogenase family)